MKKIIDIYKNAYSGLPRASWFLSLVVLINRSGTMVVPFMALYLHKELNFTIDKAGLVMAVLGVGSLTGTLLGGWLTDRIGSYIVQLISLLGSGTLFIVLGFIHTFELFVACSFLLMLIADMLRPANSVSIATYAPSEHLARAYSLNRMAINLGFSLGPSIGGYLASKSYFLLFIADGCTSIFAGLFFWFMFSPKRAKLPPPEKSTANSDEIVRSPWRDGLYLCFIGLTALFAICFLQITNSLTLFYAEIYDLSESYIGFLLSLNGLIVFAFEMVIVNALSNKKHPLVISLFGTMLVGTAYGMLNITHGMWLLVVSMILLSLGEILSMPFMNSFAAKRASNAKRGAYMAMYSMCYSIAFIVSPAAGTRTVVLWGFDTLWYAEFIMAIIIVIGLYGVYKYIGRNTQ